MQRSLNHNGTDGADPVGINMMLPFLVLVILIVMVMRLLMVTTVAMAGLVYSRYKHDADFPGLSIDSLHQPVKKCENKSRPSPARSLQ